jgi:serine carboxypeptidase 1
MRRLNEISNFHFSYQSSSALKKQLLLSPRTAAFDVMVKRKRLSAVDDENDDEDGDRKLTRLMRGEVHEALNLPENVVWGSQAGAVFDTLAGDFMKPVVETVETVLNSTTVKVVVYNGQLDLICATPGTVEWVNNMKWYGAKDYANAPRDGIGVNNILEGYSRRYGNFSMYWVSVM